MSSDLFDQIQQDAEEEKQGAQVTDLGSLRPLIEELVQLGGEIAQLEEQLRAKEERYNALRLDELPQKMIELGHVLVKSTTGATVETKSFLSAKDTPEGQAWLDANGLGDVIKRTVAVELGKESAEDAKRITELLTEAGFTPVSKSVVHPQTLVATLKQELKRGKPVPLNIFNGISGTIVDVTGLPKRRYKKS